MENEIMHFSHNTRAMVDDRTGIGTGRGSHHHQYMQ
jgi:hypothetical protein